MNENKNRIWYPISLLPTFIGQTDQIIDALENQRKLFFRAKNKSGALADDIINRSPVLLKKNSENIFLYQEQLHQWRGKIQSDFQKKLLDALAQKILQARDLNAKLLDLSKQLSKNTINKIP